MCVGHGFSAVAAYASSIPAMALRAIAGIEDSVVVLTQHSRILGVCLATIFVGFHVVDLAAVGWDVAVGPGADKVFGHGEDALLVGGEAGFVEVDLAFGRVEEPDVELVTQRALHRGVDELRAGEGGAVSGANKLVFTVSADDFRGLI